MGMPQASLGIKVKNEIPQVSSKQTVLVVSNSMISQQPENLCILQACEVPKPAGTSPHTTRRQLEHCCYATCFVNADLLPVSWGCWSLLTPL